ncbi:MAG: D-glycero-beta-D-manno-heptose 1-phosphate adenylyltransferase, partial [Candidatus Portnoybacteria bacterium CG23_combo_of_CG06-09_8_20_14_all_37_13]
MLTDKKILNYDNIARKLASHRKKGEKIVFVTGCFDIMHFGH